METIIRDLFQKLTTTTEQFLSSYDSFTPDQLVAKEDVDNWSPNQVMEHILIAEIGTFGYILKKVSGGWEELPEVDNSANPGAVELVSRLNSDIRIKAPGILPEPTNTLSIEAMMAKWKQLRTELELFLNSIPAHHLNKMVFRQPSAGPMNIVQTLEFLDAHIGHHMHQIARIKSKYNL